jgi:hypothetical protein
VRPIEGHVTRNGLNRSGHYEVDEIEAKQSDFSTHTHTHTCNPLNAVCNNIILG